MEEKILYSMESPFQQEINVKGYYFGKNEGKERSACIVGALRGNEYQQLYICSKLIDVLKKDRKTWRYGGREWYFSDSFRKQYVDGFW